MRVLIVGAGEVGFHLAERLSQENQDVVLIETDPERAEDLWGAPPRPPGGIAPEAPGVCPGRGT